MIDCSKIQFFSTFSRKLTNERYAYQIYSHSEHKLFYENLYKVSFYPSFLKDIVTWWRKNEMMIFQASYNFIREVDAIKYVLSSDFNTITLWRIKVWRTIRHLCRNMCCHLTRLQKEKCVRLPYLRWHHSIIIIACLLRALKGSWRIFLPFQLSSYQRSMIFP